MVPQVKVQTQEFQYSLAESVCGSPINKQMKGRNGQPSTANISVNASGYNFNNYADPDVSTNKDANEN